MEDEMERVNRIWRHPGYQECLEKIRLLEEGRLFCRHTPEHFLDVARLTCLLAIERGIAVRRELVYAAGLLHDIGRFRQYEEGIPHEEAGAAIAREILLDCGFEEEEEEEILRLILSHRTKQGEKQRESARTELADLFRCADKLSRNCFSCPAQEACDWPYEKKNMIISY